MLVFKNSWVVGEVGVVGFFRARKHQKSRQQQNEFIFVVFTSHIHEIMLSSVVRRGGALAKKCISSASRSSALFVIKQKQQKQTQRHQNNLFIKSQNYSTQPAAPKPSSLKQISESWLSATSANYLDNLYDTWKQDPSSVPSSWAEFFSKLDAGVEPGDYPVNPIITMEGLPHLAQAAASSGNIDLKTIEDSLKIMLLVRSYQVRGHTQAKTDPLGMSQPRVFPELLPETYGFTAADLDREFYIPMNPGLISGFLSGNKPKRTLREIMEKLKQTYCSNIGVEFMHIQNRDENNWIKEHFETERKYSFSKVSHRKIIALFSSYFGYFCGHLLSFTSYFGGSLFFGAFIFPLGFYIREPSSRNIIIYFGK